MTDPLITLTTDFGEDAPYVAALKGVILGINPRARVLDLSHAIPPQDLRHTAFFLKTAIPYFPREAIHVIVVDPGVGSERALLYVEVAGHQLLVPDNGCWTPLIPPGNAIPTVRVLADPHYWRQPVSATFHGRDILAPAAAWLSRGVSPELLGPVVSKWVNLPIPKPELGPDRLRGEVIFVDHYGNLITNIPGEAFLALRDRSLRVSVGNAETSLKVRTYSDAAPGTLVALVSSSGMLEVAVVQGSAAARTGAALGTPVTVAALH
jgi:S-adenosylmethionine hydrolase